MSEHEKSVDESWKDQVSHEAQGCDCQHQDCQSSSCGCDDGAADHAEEMEVNFLNYITSLAFQTMIFLGEIPNPMTNQQDKNLGQAKFLLDTLILLRDKTKGNLDAKEDEILGSAIYELQLKYVEAVKNESPLV